MTAFSITAVCERSRILRGGGLALLLLALELTTAAPCWAQAAPTEAGREEARERFDRGLRLFNQQDNEGALAEFTRAYQLVPHAMVLYNIGLVHAARGRPVDAVEAFDRLLQAPTGIDAEKLGRVRLERERQAALIGELEIVTSVAGALIELDGVEAGRTPLTKPLRVASGTHVVGVIAQGYAPLRKRVAVASATKTPLAFELVPQEVQLAHLEIRTRVPKLQVFVDGEQVGQTPLPASLALAPGDCKVELRRDGYTSALRTITLGPGATGMLELDPAIDAEALRSNGGDLDLAISESGAVVFIDGESRGPYVSPLRLPPGEHVVRVERGEFFPVERKVEVPVRSRALVRIELEPTPEKRTRYRNAATAQRTWGYVTLGAGALIAAGGTGFLIWNAGDVSEKEDEFEAEADRNSPGGECDPQVSQTDACLVALDNALTNLEDARGREVYGWIGVGVGAAALGTGVVLLLTGNDPDRYEPKAESDVFGRGRWLPHGWIAPGGGGLGLSGRF